MIGILRTTAYQLVLARRWDGILCTTACDLVLARWKSFQNGLFLESVHGNHKILERKTRWIRSLSYYMNPAGSSRPVLHSKPLYYWSVLEQQQLYVSSKKCCTSSSTRPPARSQRSMHLKRYALVYIPLVKIWIFLFWNKLNARFHFHMEFLSCLSLAFSTFPRKQHGQLQYLPWACKYGQ